MAKEDTQSRTVRVSNLDEWADLLHSAPRRPLLTHLNADTTWLIQLPYPPAVKAPAGRTHFNVLLDPWLQGPQSDVAWWFSTQWHVVPPSIATIEDLNLTLCQLEQRSAAAADGAAQAADDSSKNTSPQSFIDVVAISHEFTDHCHKATLEELPKSTPVFATDVAADLIRSWGHFDSVITTPALGPDVHWSRLTLGSLPDWVAIGRVISPGNALYYHSAVLIIFNLDNGGGSTHAETIIYSPHGIESQDLSHLSSSGLKPLALLHGLHDVSIWLVKQLNLGALNGIRAVGTSGVRYWIATHDEVKTGGGLIAPWLRRIPYTTKQVVASEQSRLEREGKKLPEYDFVELGSGDGIVLE
jgi:hypothetical protein